MKRPDINTLKSAVRRVDPLDSLAQAVAVLLSFIVGAYITGRFHGESRYFGAMLASIAAVVVFQGDTKASEKMGWLRILSTFIGAVLAVVYLYLFHFTIGGMVVAVFVVSVFCMLVGVPDNGRIAIMTLVIVLIISKLSPQIKPFVNGLLRFLEAAVGSGIGIGSAWLLDKRRARLAERHAKHKTD